MAIDQLSAAKEVNYDLQLDRDPSAKLPGSEKKKYALEDRHYVASVEQALLARGKKVG
jgi:hypothetical protein